jgi:thiosulfate/3-mercaptopyruvate sulfurtransferase
MSEKGISRDTTVVFYGDNFNWWAAYALWVFGLFGHPDTRLLDGGRMKWVADGRPMTTDVPKRPNTDYPVIERDDSKIRAYKEAVLDHMGQEKPMVDVRSPEEFRGELLAPPHLPQEQAQVPGHIPGASNITWAKAAREDGTFKSADELTKLYSEEGITGEEPIIAYCRIGERSSHSWFVLQELLGYPDVKNYDGSWTEYGSLVGVGVEKG